MADQDLSEFYARVARVEKARAKGFGFEAAGAFGRAHYQHPTRRRRRFLAPLLVTLAVFFCLKATLMYQIGQHVYDARISQMQAAESSMERVAASIMQADPVTVWISGRIEQALRP